MKSLIVSLCFFVTSMGSVSLVHGLLNRGEQKIVLLLGPPGSGKGTQAIRLSKDLGIPHISTGDLFRENMKNSTPVGLQAKSYINTGKLVPDNIVLEMLFQRVSQPDCVHGFLLDGFPRTLAQAEALEERLPKNAKIVVINLNVDDETIIKRSEGRLTCPSCGNVHNRYFSPPVVENLCDQCKTQLVQRPDDKREVVEERLRVYHAQTKPLIGYYEGKNLLFSVRADKSPDAVYREIQKIVHSID